MSFDLGESRRLRGVAPREMTFTGDDGEVEAKYRLVGELPAAFFDAGAGGRFVDAFKSLFLDPEDGDAFVERYNPSVNDLAEIVSSLYPGLGENLGEALRSGTRATGSGTS